MLTPKPSSLLPGPWGRQGCTHVHLASATEKAVRPALAEAWQLGAEKKPTRPRRKP